jgi:hypothetical protein
MVSVANRLRARRPPDPDLDLGEHPIEHPLGLAVRPPVGVRAERQDLAPAVRPDTEAVGDLAVPTLVHPDLSARPLLHNACLTQGMFAAGGSPRGGHEI